MRKFFSKFKSRKNGTNANHCNIEQKATNEPGNVPDRNNSASLPIDTDTDSKDLLSMPENINVDTGNSSKPTHPSDMSFEAWFTTNTEILTSVSDAVKSLEAPRVDIQSLDRTFASYGDISKILLKGLKLLADVHPVIQVTVSTFEIVLAFESTRRENNRKVGILRLQTQDLLIAIFQLHSLAPEETALGGRKVDLMGALMKRIAQDIKIASSVCDFYMNKKFISRIIKSLHYESVFAEHIARLVKNRQDLELALQVHMARAMDSVNTKLENLFRQLETTRERDVQKLLKDNDGAEKCIGNELLLDELIQKSGVGVEGVLGHQAEPNKSWSESMKKIQKELLKELAEDVREAFKKNIDHFNKKLDLQEQQLIDIKKGNDKIISTLEAGPHQYIIDADFKELWKSMAWKRNVKARYLVLALYDHLVEKLGGIGTNRRASNENDQWALSYFNGAHVQPLLEAIDDDATGFITTREINTFIESVPECWTILQWIAYWAEGWHLSVNQYKEKIYMLLSTMYNTYPRVLPGNRDAVITYLQHETIYQVDKLLLSTHDMSPNPFGSRELCNLTEKFTDSEEKRIQKNLEAINFDIDAVSTVSLITGPGRIERYIYPLMYLILRRHLAIVRLSTVKILHPYEIPAMTSSLWILFFVVQQRVENLSSIFKQSNVDVVEKLENFAFGMFKLYHDNPDKEPSKSAIAKYANEWPHIVGDELSTANCTPLHKPPEEAAYCFPSHFNVDTSEDLVQGQWAGHIYYGRESQYGLIQLAIESKNNGTFTGRAASWKFTMDVSGEVREDGTVHIRVMHDDGWPIDLIGQLDAETGTIGTIKGSYGYPGDEQYYDLEGGTEKDDEKSAHWPDQTMEEQEDQDQAPQHLSRVATEGDNRTARSEDIGAAQGSYSSSAGIESRSEVPEDALPAPGGYAPVYLGLDGHIHTFLLRRTPASLCQFLPGDPRYYPVTDGDAGQRARARWRFALGAVLEQIKSTLLTWNYVKERFTQVRRFVELARKERYMEENYCPRLAPLSKEEAKELSCLKCSISPMHTRSYYALLSDEIERKKYNDYTCDSCRSRIVGSRLACLTCMNNSFTDTTDLCMSCIRNSCDLRGFAHDPSHVLLKFDTLVLDANMHWIIPKARSMLPRIQEEFRSSLKYRPELEERTGPASSWHSSQSKEMLTINESTPLPKCESCEEMISIPCWVYVTYWPTGDMYVCDKCDSGGKKPGKEYLMSWPLLRIGDAPVAAVTLEARFAALEQKFDEQLSVLTKLLEKLPSNSPPDAGAKSGAGF